jgi:CRP-like cAMP-binding protein
MAQSNNPPVSPRANRIIAALSDDDYESMSRDLQRLYLPQKSPMIDANQPITVVDFPLHGLASQVATMQDGTTVEVGPIGREGTTGLPLFLGATTTPIDTFMQIPGEVMRMSAGAFIAATDRMPAFRRALQLYAEATVSSMGWWVACNRAHVIQQRMARWLLMSHDRVLGDEFSLTHEYLSQMMGVRRASVTEAANAIQEDGAIRYSRGVMTIVDRARLEALTCECYWVVTQEWDRLLGTDYLRSSKRPDAEP